MKKLATLLLLSFAVLLILLPISGSGKFDVSNSVVADGSPLPPFPPPGVLMADGSPLPPFPPPGVLMADGSPLPPFPPTGVLMVDGSPLPAQTLAIA